MKNFIKISFLFTLLLAVLFVGIPYASFALSPQGDVLPSVSLGEWLAYAVAGLELLLRVLPTGKPRSILVYVLRFADLVIPNRAKMVSGDIGRFKLNYSKQEKRSGNYGL